MDPEIRVELRLRSKHTSLDIITEQLGILPTRVFKIGDFIQKTKIRIKDNIWCFSVEYPGKTDDLSDHIEPIIENLYKKREIIQRLCTEKELYCEIACTIYIVRELPTIFLKPEIMKKISELNANLNIDILLTE